MIDSPRLLADLTAIVGQLETDLRTQLDAREDVRARLQEEYDAARRVGRTVVTFEAWAEDPVTQAAVAWVLGTVFIRFFEDNGLVEPRLSGVGPRHTRAVQEHQHYFQQHPTHSERDYLEHVFRAVGALPAAAALFDPKHNPLWRLPLSADAARALVAFWQRIDPDTGRVAHDFTDADLDTRFLGDLYQDLSEPVRKRYALLQTPRFVEQFILDRTLTPAIEAFGYREVRLIDPACGSGHFLLGAFERLLSLAQHHEPGKDVRVLVRDTLPRIVGVDVNPYAVAIARMRLTIAALRACGLARLADAPAFEVNVIVADALLHGPRFTDDGAVQMSMLPDDPANQYYFAEDEAAARRLLGQQYHVVVGNPPYITVKDRALNALYRKRYPRTCHMKYSLVAPFIERCFELALAAPAGPPVSSGRSPGSSDPGADTGPSIAAAGHVGLIVANSFMKREFGSKLIEDFLQRVDLTHVVDTSGAYIPGHGTPTVILFGRHRKPSPVTRTVMGIRGEPSTPDDPSRGLVWSAILDQIDRVDSESAFVSVRDLEQTSLHKHPWSIGGGGAAELKELLDERGEKTLGEVAASVGVQVVTLEDDAFVLGSYSALRRRRVPPVHCTTLVEGDQIRDWCDGATPNALLPYDVRDFMFSAPAEALRFLWALRTGLRSRLLFGKTQDQRGLPWAAYGMFISSKARTPLSIAFAEVATHNHFVLDRGGKVFKQTAPVIKLPPDATEDDHLALLGLLNSSTACFWMKQVCQTKGSSGMGRGVYDEKWEFFYQVNAAKLAEFPVTSLDGTVAFARQLDTAGRQLADWATVVPRSGEEKAAAAERAERLLASMISLQEELDWAVYRAYGLLPADMTHQGSEPPPLKLGERAFEIVMARKMAEGELETTWFERHGSTPITEVPAHWPDDYRRLVERRIALIESDRTIALIEQPEYKRRWNVEPWEQKQERALRSWLLDRLEDPRYWPSPELTTCRRLADEATRDEEFMRVAEVYRARPDFDVTALITELVTMEGVPYLPVLRYTESGLRKRAQWERTWELQRLEDHAAALAVGAPLVGAHAPPVGAQIPVPPKYTSADFRKQEWWRLRGKLDVPKERFVLYPGAERAADPTPVLAWAGWDHAQQARALGAYYMRLKGEEGSASPKLAPLLAGMLDLLPWVRQWHGGIDAEFGEDLGAYYAGFIDGEARALGLTVEQVRAWAPAVGGRAPRTRRANR